MANLILYIGIIVFLLSCLLVAKKALQAKNSFFDSFFYELHKNKPCNSPFILHLIIMSAADKANAWKQFDAVMASSDREQRGASRGGQAPSRQGHGGGHKPYHNPFFDRNRDEGRQPQHRQHHTQHRPHQLQHRQHQPQHRQHRKPYDRRPFNRQAPHVLSRNVPHNRCGNLFAKVIALRQMWNGASLLTHM